MEDEGMIPRICCLCYFMYILKLELARAMLYKADLLLLDEPTNHVRTWFTQSLYR